MNPPLVVFVVGLFSFGLTTLILAGVIRGKSDINNPDVLDWNEFFFKLSELELCLVKEPETSKQAQREKDWVKAFLSLPMAASLVKSFQQMTSERIIARGGLQLGVLSHGFPKKFRQTNITMSLDIPAPTGDANMSMCVEVEGPQSLLRELSGSGELPNSCVVGASATKNEAGKLVILPGEQSPGGSCTNGTSLRLAYDLQPGWRSIYLTDSDVSLIYVHLLCTSMFLFVVGACTFACAVVRSRRRQSKSMADERGSMQMVPQCE